MAEVSFLPSANTRKRASASREDLHQNKAKPALLHPVAARAPFLSNVAFPVQKKNTSQRGCLQATLIIHLLKLINYFCSCYPTRASYSVAVDGFRNPIKHELKTTACSVENKRNVNFLNLHIDKVRKTHAKQSCNHTFYQINLNRPLLTLDITVELLNSPRQKGQFFSRAIVETVTSGSL